MLILGSPLTFAYSRASLGPSEDTFASRHNPAFPPAPPVSTSRPHLVIPGWQRGALGSLPGRGPPPCQAAPTWSQQGPGTRAKTRETKPEVGSSKVSAQCVLPAAGVAPGLPLLLPEGTSRESPFVSGTHSDRPSCTSGSRQDP